MRWSRRVRGLIDLIHAHSHVDVNMLALMSAGVCSQLFAYSYLHEYVSLLHGEVWLLYSLAYFLRFIHRLGCQSMYLSSAYADNMWDVTGIPLLASLATLSLVTASQMAGQLCALICAIPCRVCVCLCVCGCVRACV